jgi:hypothetical protein
MTTPVTIGLAIKGATAQLAKNNGKQKISERKKFFMNASFTYLCGTTNFQKRDKNMSNLYEEKFVLDDLYCQKTSTYTDPTEDEEDEGWPDDEDREHGYRIFAEVDDDDDEDDWEDDDDEDFDDDDDDDFDDDDDLDEDYDDEEDDWEDDDDDFDDDDDDYDDDDDDDDDYDDYDDDDYDDDDDDDDDWDNDEDDDEDE